MPAYILAASGISGTVNNWSPVGASTSTGVVTVTPSDNAIVTGLVPTGFGNDRLLIIRNTSSSNSLTLNHVDSGSSAANRFSLVNSANLVVRPLGSVIVYYDSTDTVWYSLGQI